MNAAGFIINFTIITEYPAWLIILCLLLGAIYSGILYYRSRFFAETSPLIRRSLAFFRFLVVSLLAFLLLGPLLKNLVTEVEKPVIVIAQDNSQSLVIGRDSSFYRDEYPRQIKKIAGELGDKFDVKFYTFGDKVAAADNFTFTDKQTDISSLMEEINNRYSNRNLGAVILASDGIYNKGANPVYASEKIKAPFYIIALGDTSLKKDIILSKVFHNRLAYLGNTFPLEILISANQCRGCVTRLTVSRGNQALFTKPVTIENNKFTVTIPVQIEAKEAGLQRYRISLSRVEGEVTYENNTQEIFIDVLDSRQKILVLANSPHPDIAALKNAIEFNQNYEVIVSLASELSRPLEEFNLIILHQLPSVNNPVSRVLQEVNENNLSHLFIIGGQSSLNIFNQQQEGVTITASPGRFNESQAALSPDFALFTLSEQTSGLIRRAPPLLAPFGAYRTANSAQVLFNQKIGVVETSDPLILFNAQNETKSAVITGEGIWKWRLFNYMETKNHEAFNELIGKIVQYLSIKVDKSFFRIISKNNFTENEPVTFEAEVYNESYELVNEPEVNINIINEEGKKYPYAFTKTSNVYRLNAGVFPPGDYRYEATAKVGDKLLSEKGEFTVSEIKIELVNSLADHALLYQLARKHNGEMIYPQDVEKLPEIIGSREDIKPVAYSEQKLSELINLKWVFFLFLLLLSAEWVIRKRNGAY